MGGSTNSLDEMTGSVAAPAGQSVPVTPRTVARGVRQPDVDRAADAILAKGERPTIEKVRQVLGTGSPNTVTPLLERWYRQLPARIPDLQAGYVGGDRAPSAVKSAFDLFWDTAMLEARAAAHKELAGERQALEVESARLGEEQRVLQATRGALEEGMRLAQEQATELNAVLQERTTKLAQAEAQVRELTQALQSSQQATAAAHESARRQLAEQAEAHARERQRDAERADATERRLNVEVDRAREEAKAVRQELKAARDEAAKTVARLEGEQERQAGATREAQARAGGLQQQCDALLGRVREAEHAQTLAQAAAAEAGRAEGAARELLAQAQARVGDLGAALASERQGAISLREQLSAALQRAAPAGRPGRTST